jgi:hypothetical protein
MLLSPASYSGAAAIPEAAAGGADRRTTASPDRFALLIGLGCPGGTRNGVGLSPVSVDSHCVQARPPITPTGRSDEPYHVLRRESPWTPPCFRRLGSLALRRGRNVAPPELSLPGPFVAAHYWAVLAAYLSIESSSKDFRTGTAPRG